ncbi:MAG: acetoacetate decarboxylase family protein [Myxococcota bacterium]
MRPLYARDARFSVLPPPVASRGGTLHTFLVPADEAALARLVRREFVEPSGGAVQARPLGPFVWVVFADLPELVSLRDEAAGSLAEREAAVWVPIEDGDGHPSFFVPFMFVDSGPALTAGRETLGLPKELATVSMAPFAAEVDHTPVLRASPAASRAWGSPVSLRAALRLLRATRTAVPLTQLRQLPAIDDPTRAALTEIVSLEARPTSLPRMSRLTGPWEVRFPDDASHPIRRALGVDAVVPSALSASVRPDFTLDGVGTRWSSASPLPARQRLLVLGGGLGSLSTLFELTSDPSWRTRWDITVLQPGWRLGGKAASSRDTTRHDRSEEHGLHVWFGFYRNAFRLVREVYAALDRPADHPWARPEQVFAPQSRVCYHEVRDGRPWTWIVDYPTDPGFPGDPRVREADWTALPSPARLLRHTLTALGALLRGRPLMRHRHGAHEVEPPSWTRVLAGWVLKARLHRALRDLERTPAEESGPHLATIRSRLRHAIGDPSEHPPDLVQAWIVAESALAIGLGLVRDDLVRRGYDAVDGEDFRAWLARHGAPDDVLRSAPLKALYDAAFAYAHGDPAKPDLPAGIALVTILRMVFTYEGSILWKTRVGMGEAVIAPLYEVLERRGVRFRFFHRVDRLALSADGRSIGAVHVTEQVRTRGAYAPLFEVAGLPCWPSRPLCDQLVDGEALEGTDPSWLESGAEGGPAAGRHVLEAGRDYDRVLLGIGLGALPRVCAELAAARPAWRAALDGLPAVRTAAAQVWMRRSTAERTDGVEAIDNLASAVLPSWIDMAPVLRTERWSTDAPTGLLYGAGVLPDDVPLEAATSVARAQVDQVLSRHLADLAPRSPGPDTIHGADDPEGRYVRANVHGSELYERAGSGTAHLRLPADGSGFENLVLTGTWTRTGFHIGSVEAAVMSGRLAATALDGVPRHVVGGTR